MLLTTIDVACVAASGYRLLQNLVTLWFCIFGQSSNFQLMIYCLADQMKLSIVDIEDSSLFSLQLNITSSANLCEY